MKAQKLVEIVNTSDTLDEAIARSGMAYNNLMTRCNGHQIGLKLCPNSTYNLPRYGV
jgi:hypothetical protein